MGREEVSHALPPGEPQLHYEGAYGNDSHRSAGGPRHSSGQYSDDEGVEIVLGPEGSNPKVLMSAESRNKATAQNVFRGDANSSRGRSRDPARTPSYGGPPPTHGSGSFGYGPPVPYGGEYPPHPMTVPYSNHSGSFEEGYNQNQHYSPHVQYSQPAGYPGDDINVISPNHGSRKDDSPPRSTRPPRPAPTNRHAPPSGYYRYPPSSPVSRPGGAPSNSREGRHPSTQRSDSYHPEDGTWNPFPQTADPRGQPPVVAESSFDSEHHPSPYSSYAPPPGEGQGAVGAPPTPTESYDAHQQFYGGNAWGSFDSQPAPPHFDDKRYYGYPSAPESPYGAYGGGYYGEPYPQYAQTPNNDGEHGTYSSHYEVGAPHVTPIEQRSSVRGEAISMSSNSKGMMLPDAAREVPFEVTDPPSEPCMPGSNIPSCQSVAELNGDDVLCGRGGGTNSQIGNRRFRQLVQDFQPTYLMARRKEKPRIARTIVLIIRGRGGRFLKKDEDSGMLYEVGDQKAEAKTSQALREGLDVRATKSAEKTTKKKKKKGEDEDAVEETEDIASISKEEAPENEVVETPKQESSGTAQRKETPRKEGQFGETTPTLKTPPSREPAPPRAGVARAMRDRTPSPPPALPHLQVGPRAGLTNSHSPEALQFHKRRRMRSGEGCVPFEDKLFPDFCPPRADLCRTSPDPEDDDDVLLNSNMQPRRHAAREYEQTEYLPQPGCADIAMMMMSGATGGLCFQKQWRR